MSLRTASDLLLFFQVGRVFSGLLPTSWGMSLITSHSSLPPSPHSSTAQQQRHITHDMPYSHSTVGPEVCRKLVLSGSVAHTTTGEAAKLVMWDGKEA